jgi:hypothetical protein
MRALVWFVAVCLAVTAMGCSDDAVLDEPVRVAVYDAGDGGEDVGQMFCMGDDECTTGGSQCFVGLCVSGVCAPMIAPDGHACSATGKPGQCVAGQCALGCATSSNCMPVDQCKQSTCVGGVCAHMDKLDGSECSFGVCYAGNCMQVIPCDDGNPCTTNYTLPNGTCASAPMTTQLPCAFGASQGICVGTMCSCDTDDDCDDGDAATDDHCLDFSCFHSSSP